MTDDTYREIFKDGHPPLRMPVPPPPDVPSVLRGQPTCETHCSGRHELDAILTCDHCRGEKYAVILHEYRHQSGHFFNEMRPLNGAPPYSKATGTCCGCDLRRR